MKRFLFFIFVIIMIIGITASSLADNLNDIVFPCTGFTTKSNVNVRQSASSKSDLVIKIKEKETEVIVLGIEKTGDVTWYQIETQNNKKGYIREDLLGLKATSNTESFPADKSVSSTSSTVVTTDTIIDLDEILESIGISSEDASHIERIDDWANGPRYRFSTHGTTARVYCNMDGTVHTIKIGIDTDLFRQGYESWSIENFLVDEGVSISIVASTQESVKKHLKYPSTADFPLLDWNVSREFNKYTVSSNVKAKNAFGVENTIPFTAQFWVENDKATLIYLVVDTNIIKDITAKYPLPERKEIGGQSTDSTSPNNKIRIIDEQLGEYGERVKLDSDEYCWYHVPAGRYIVTSNSKFCMVYVDKNKITRNSSGYVEMKNVITLELKYGESKEISIKEDEHIFLTINADITLTPIK